jgi:DNA-binding transcriptional MerR regulator
LQDAFTAKQASALTGCTAHQLRYWDRVALVQPSIQSSGGRAGVRRLYSFRDLVWLRVVKGLLDNGMSVQRVRRAADYLRRNADLDDTLASVRLVTDGQSIFQVLVLAIDEITQDVAEDVTRFELDKQQFLEVVRRSEDELATETG